MSDVLTRVEIALDEVLTPSEAARLLGYSSQWVVELADRGRLPSARTKFGRVFPRTQIERIAAERSAFEAV